MYRFLIIICFCIFSLFPSEFVLSAEIPQKNIDKLTNKISKKFSKTFCNTSNFGISDEGALEFAIGETKKQFSKNKYINDIDYGELNKKIISNIELDCQVFGFPMENLSNINFSDG